MHINLDHIGWNWIRLDQIRLYWIKMNLRNRIKLVFKKMTWSWQSQSWHGLNFILNISTRGLRLTFNLVLIHMHMHTDHGRPMKPFQNFWAKADNWADKFWGIWGIFGQVISTDLLQWVPCPYFLLFNHYFYKKLSLYIHISNMYLGLGFEFGPQRIRDLAFVCPLSVIWNITFRVTLLYF